MNSIVYGKKILLLYGRFFHYDQIVRDKLISLGAEVDLYDARAEINVIEKAFKKIDRRYYQKKQVRFHKDIQEKNKLKQYDYIFSNCYLPIETVKGYKESFPNAKLVLYLDDSVNNLRGVENTFTLYDRAITFDRSDSEYYSVDFRPLFFVDDYTFQKNKATRDIYDICFIGTCHSDRVKIVEAVEEVCNRAGRKMFHFCYLQSPVMYLYYYIRQPEYRRRPFSYFSTKQMNSFEVASIMGQSRIILDIQHPKQTGLTMRTIETIGSGKKLITTNSDIVNYDFYNSDNILVIDRNNPVISPQFFETEYKDISFELYNKYSITGWIEEIFR